MSHACVFGLGYLDEAEEMQEQALAKWTTCQSCAWHSRQTIALKGV